MTRLERALRILEDEFDVFVVLGSIYQPATGETQSARITHGNAYAAEAMVDEAYGAQQFEEAYNGEEERDG